jgi:thiosulfate/3-mercaptopyruvate sulfurtransferase
MRSFILCILISFIFNLLHASESIFISPKVAIKMIDKKEITFLTFDSVSLKIKESKTVDINFLESFDILGRTLCSPFYLCTNKVEKYFSSLGISSNDVLVIYDSTYGINAATLYVVLESMGHKNISILRGRMEDISNLDPNWKIYNNYLNELKGETTKESKIREKINILKSHLLLQEDNLTVSKNVNTNYTASKMTSRYFLTKKELKKLVHEVRVKESNLSIIDACEMIDIVGSKNGSYRAGVKSLLWKELIDKKQQSLKSNEELAQLFESLELKKSEQHYVYCMSGAQKAFYVMIALRELGYAKVKVFIGDWNTWVGDINE